MKRLALVATLALLPLAAAAQAELPLSYGDRPFYLIDKLDDGPLKEKLTACMGQAPAPSDFSIGHRGAPLQFPEHTDVSYVAAAQQGAGIVECDVTFTKDKALVCRHAQDDLATTTDILVSDLADTCATPFTPAEGGTPAAATCRTSELTLAQFQSLTPKMDSADKTAATPAAFQGGVAPWRTTLYADGAKTLTHQQSIALIGSMGAKFTPELKAPAVEMPFDGFSQQDYAQKLIDEYKAAGVPAANVWPQSFNLDDIKYWIANEPEFGAQAVYLDDRYEAWDEDEGEIDPNDPATFKPTMQELADMGVKYLAPPIWMMLTTENGEIVPSAYAKAANDAGLNLIAWSLERSGPLKNGGGWYFQSVSDAIDSDADYLEVVHVLAQDVGVKGIFSDWPATVTYYANCYGL